MLNPLRSAWRLLPFTARRFLGETVVKRPAKIAHDLFDAWMDDRYRIETQPEPIPERVFSQRSDAARNISSRYFHLLIVRRYLRLSPDDIVCDVGSGVGRALFVLAKTPCKALRGIELSETAVAAFARNASRFKGPAEKISVVRGDVAQQKYTNETVFFLFNPFGPDTLHAFLDELKSSITANPRSVRLCYLGDHVEILDRVSWLSRIRTLSVFHNPIVIYACTSSIIGRGVATEGCRHK